MAVGFVPQVIERASSEAQILDDNICIYIFVQFDERHSFGNICLTSSPRLTNHDHPVCLKTLFAFGTQTIVYISE